MLRAGRFLAPEDLWEVPLEEDEVRPGREFLHAWYWNERPAAGRARCVVTAVREGRVYYRSLIRPGERGRPDSWRELRRFADVVHEWAEAS